MTRLEKLQSATADDLASLFTIMDDEGEYLPLLMPMNLVKDPDNLDEIIQSQSEWLQGEYWPGDFGLGCNAGTSDLFINRDTARYNMA